jgi:hypothetical protein
MKATVVEKGDGFVLVRFEAQTNVEALTLSTCGMGHTNLGVQLQSDYSTVNNRPRDAGVRFDAFSLPVHTVLLEAEHQPEPTKTT